MLRHLTARPRLIFSVAAGLLASVLLPATERTVTRALIGWNIAVWLYLVLLWWTMWRDDHQRMRKVAMANAESAGVVLFGVSCATAASIAAIVAELAGAKGGGGHRELGEVLLALATVAGSWVLLPTFFALSYASLYYGDGSEQGSGLQFPAHDDHFRPDYSDFVYFSLTIAVASQTADVSISSRALRRLVTVQSALSFAFNTSILALTINIAAGLF